MDQNDKENQIKNLDLEVSQLRDQLEALRSKFTSYQEKEQLAKSSPWCPDLVMRELASGQLRSWLS
jgi:hypothetical protein